MAISSSTPFLLSQPFDSQFGTPSASQLVAGNGIIITPGYQNTPTVISAKGGGGGNIANYKITADLNSYHPPAQGSNEKISYTPGEGLKNVLGSVQTSGLLTCSLPVTFSLSSPGEFSVKVGLGTNLRQPDFNGQDGVDFISLNSIAPYPQFVFCGLCVFRPLSGISASGTVTSFDIIVKNTSTTRMIGAFSSAAIVAVTADDIQ